MNQALTNYFTTKYPGQLRPGYTSSGKVVLFFTTPDRVWNGVPIYSGFIIDEVNNRLLELLNLTVEELIRTPEYRESESDSPVNFRKNLKFQLSYRVQRKESQITWI